MRKPDSQSYVQSSYRLIDPRSQRHNRVRHHDDEGTPKTRGFTRPGRPGGGRGTEDLLICWGTCTVG